MSCSIIRLIGEAFDIKYDVNCVDSQNGKFSYGYASSPGKRSSMEDFFETRIDGVDGEIVGLFGVFDGTSLSIYLSLSLVSACTHTHTQTHFMDVFELLDRLTISFRFYYD